jgi:hypothetical protein
MGQVHTSACPPQRQSPNQPACTAGGCSAADLRAWWPLKAACTLVAASSAVAPAGPPAASSPAASAPAGGRASQAAAACLRARQQDGLTARPFWQGQQPYHPCPLEGTTPPLITPHQPLT